MWRILNDFDLVLLSFINQWSQRWREFDAIVVMVSDSDLVKGGVVIAAVWGAWFCRTKNDQPQNRAYLLSGIFGALLALFFARLLAAELPLRTRPLLAPTLHFRPPFGLRDQSNWTIWSSFPSDHAALFFSLALGVFYVSKKWGAVLFAYVVFVICFPRMYVGIHYPTDILGGAALAFSAVTFLSLDPLRAKWARPILLFHERRPGLFYLLFFLITFQIATLFWDIRILLSHFGFAS
jgi:undecaprenyl-diphosphatase